MNEGGSGANDKGGNMSGEERGLIIQGVLEV